MVFELRPVVSFLDNLYVTFLHATFLQHVCTCRVPLSRLYVGLFVVYDQLICLSCDGRHGVANARSQ